MDSNAHGMDLEFGSLDQLITFLEPDQEESNFKGDSLQHGSIFSNDDKWPF